MNQKLNPYTIAQEMMAAQDQKQQIEPFTNRLSGFDNTLAYEVSRIVHEARISEGAVPVGRKIGFTNPEMWSLYGVQEPIWAYVYDRTVTHLSSTHTRCHIEKYTEPKIEPEIVIHFKSTPPMCSDPADILGCVDWIAHGIEIVQSHYPNWEFQAADTIADSALHATLLVGEKVDMKQLGPEILSNLERFTITLSCDGNLQEQGLGSNVLGSPMAAITHLISVIAKQSNVSPLQAGELVTTGTLTPALPVYAGQKWNTCLEGIGLPGLSVTFEK